MSDDIQQRPIIETPPLLHVTAADPDSRSSGDGHLHEPPGRRRNKKTQQPSSGTPANQAAPINPSLLLQDEVNLTRSARSIMGEKHPRLTALLEPLPDASLSETQPATAEHIHITA